jgi:hypothetical protein
VLTVAFQKGQKKTGLKRDGSTTFMFAGFKKQTNK